MDVNVRKFRPKPLALEDGRTLTITMIVPEESQQLIDFLELLGTETPYTLQYPGRNYSLYAIQQRIARTAQNDKDLLLCVKDNGRLVAHIDFQLQNDGHPWIKHVARMGLAVLKDYQGVGIARALLQQVEDWAESVGVTRIEALCRTDNERGLELHRGMGYTLEGLRHNAVNVDGEYFDEYYLAKILES